MANKFNPETEDSTFDVLQPRAWQINSTLIFVGVIALVTVGIYISEFGTIRSQKQDVWGQFGDYIGGVLNPIVSFIALVVLAKTYRHQKHELSMTAKALRAEQQLANTERQESRFFDLLTLYLTTIAEIRYAKSDSPTIVFEGKRAFQEFVRVRLPNAASLPIDRPEVEANVRSLFDEHKYLLDHYFRVLSVIVSTSHRILSEDAYPYLKLLRAQLSEDELVLIGLNLLRPQAEPSIPMISYFGLLKHFPVGSLRSSLEARLPAGSFGSASRSNVQGEVASAS